MIKNRATKAEKQIYKERGEEVNLRKSSKEISI